VRGRIRIDRALGLYVTHLKNKKYSPSTVISVRNVFSAFYRESGLGASTALTSVTPQIAERVMGRFHKRYKPNTGWRYGSMLLQVFRGFAAGGLLIENPFSKIPSPTRPDILPLPVLSKEEVAKLLKACQIKYPSGIRNRALLEVLYSTGLRLSECSTLELGDADYERGTLHVRGKGGRDRLVPIGREAAKWLTRYVTDVRPKWAGTSKLLWFGQMKNPLKNIWIQRTIRWLGERARLSKRVTPHTLRRTCATHLLAGGASAWIVKELLGHQDTSCLARYLRVQPKELQDAHTQTHPRS
jgi:integrase/recombinase XerD